MNWKRGLFRVYLVLSVLWFGWAMWTWMWGSWSQAETRQHFVNSCYDPDLHPNSTPIEWEKCVAHAIRTYPVGLQLWSKEPKVSAIMTSVIVAVPVILWWLLRGLVALVRWIGRGFRQATAPVVAGLLAVLVLVGCTTAKNPSASPPPPAPKTTEQLFADKQLPGRYTFGMAGGWLMRYDTAKGTACAYANVSDDAAAHEFRLESKRIFHDPTLTPRERSKQQEDLHEFLAPGTIPSCDKVDRTANDNQRGGG